MLERVATLLERHGVRVAVLLIGAATLARLVGAAGAIDAAAGPDAGSYIPAAHALSSHGLLHAAPNLPYWPAGYPTFLALVFDVAGQTLRVVVVLQVLLLGLASWSLYSLVRRELGGAPALAAVALLSASPALLAAADETMYETVLGSGLVIAADLLSRSRHLLSRSPSSSPGRARLLAGGGGLLLGLAGTMQPKTLVLVPFAAAWVFAGRRSVALAATVLAAAALGPIALALRTQDTAGHLALSANLGATARIGLNDHASGGYRYTLQTLEGCGLAPSLLSRNREGFSDAQLFAFDHKLTGCAASWAEGHPAQTLWLALKKALYFWSPMVGPTVAQRDATWAQPFDLRRLAPAGVRNSAPFKALVEVLFNAWTVIVLVSIAAGVALAWRSGRRLATAALLLPVLCFMAISMVTIGDPRFRLPVAPFYIAFQGVALAAVAQQLWRRWARPSTNPPAGAPRREPLSAATGHQPTRAAQPL